uniref:G-protein coupled receptors family 3 profile domain-containing protein n=1 Tax=Odontella aurita TaxID=265563 RepID=A0A7S4N406_9STRA|mmetsp:Transcript_46673/g.141406  ORF Transcript_46673/g.141406 Transcript_46673/m.141406 type:complete len:741 (+) Transcript_46673:183-2405(+)
MRSISSLSSTIRAAAKAIFISLAVGRCLHVVPLVDAATGDHVTKSYTFAVVPKRTNSPYWQVVRTGCETRAKRLSKEMGANVTCLFTGPDEGGPQTQARQAAIVEDLIAGGEIDGLALAVVEAPSAETLIEKAVAKGIQVVTFDTDAVNSRRLAYIGTDNVAMGTELGRVLLQIKPGGGTYGLVGAGSPNIQERYQGVRDALANSAWMEVEDSPKNCEGNSTLAVQQMFELASAHADLGAIIPVGAWPMLDGAYWQDYVDENVDVLTVVGDSLQQQIDLMDMGYANALVGQLPFEMGKLAIDRLLQVRQSQENGEGLPFTDRIFPTNFLGVVNIPQDIPPMQINMNYIGGLVIFGYILCGILCLLSVGFAIFSFVNRSHPIIKKSQPKFLIMLCVGTLIAGLAIIPLSIDDEKYTQRGCDIACMASPWLIFIGFTTCYSALFSKIWRVNKIFHHPKRFQRLKVTEKDVLVPFAVLMTINVITLLCWTLLAPITYKRVASSGTDNWNRVYKSYYGTCSSSTDTRGGFLPYIIILVVVNCTAIIIANIQAYQARNIHTEFSESRYIAMATASMFQAFLIGIPVPALVRENPRAEFIILSIFIFVTCAAILLLTYLPKIGYMKEYNMQKKDHDAKRGAKKSDSEAGASVDDVGTESTTTTNEDLRYTILEVSEEFEQPSFKLRSCHSIRRSTAESWAANDRDPSIFLNESPNHTRSVRFEEECANNMEPAIHASTHASTKEGV